MNHKKKISLLIILIFIVAAIIFGIGRSNKKDQKIKNYNYRIIHGDKISEKEFREAKKRGELAQQGAVAYLIDEKLYKYFKSVDGMEWVSEIREKCPTKEELSLIFSDYSILLINFPQTNSHKDEKQQAICFLGLFCDIYKRCPEDKNIILNYLNQYYKYIGDRHNIGYSIGSLTVDIGHYPCEEFKTTTFWEKTKNSINLWTTLMRYYSYSSSPQDIEKLKEMLNDPTLDPRKKEDINLCLRNNERFDKNMPPESLQWKYKP